MIALLRWLIRFAGSWTLLALGLLILAMDCLAWTISGSVKDLHLSFAIALVTLACLLGWLLARSHLRTWVSAVIALTGGLLVALFVPGRLLNPTISFLVQAWRYGEAALKRSGGQAETLGLQTSYAAFATAIHEAALHGAAWFTALISGQPGYDYLIVPVLWSLIIWILAAWSVWGTRRLHSPLAGLAPAGIILAGLLNFRREGAYVILPFVGLCLVLLFTHNHHSLEGSWAKRQVDYSTEMRMDTAFSALPLILALLIAAAIVPSVSAQPIADLARRAVGNRVESFRRAGESLGLRTKSGPATSAFASGGLPRSHLLGAGPELSEHLVMSVRVSGVTALPGSSQTPPRYYWRSLTFDQYTGRGWESSPWDKLEYGANQPLFLTIGPDQALVEQEFEFVQGSGGLVYAAGDVLQADHRIGVDWRKPGNASDSTQDLYGVELDTRTYRVKSLVTDASAEWLRTAGEDYPAWIKDRYLALPDTIPERVRSLANEITAGAATPYDKARRIQDYLRTIPYNLDIPEPPPGRDVVDYFLFDLKQGYCDYYATAMVVLARQAGVPARLVMGYATGNFDPASSRYLVTEADAHSWVEVYFPGAGWIEFEPTASRSPIEHRDANQAAPPESEGWQIPAQPWYRQIFSSQNGLNLVAIPIVLILLALLGLLLYAWLDYIRLKTASPQSVLNMLYGRLRQRGAALIQNPHPGLTPYEYSAALRECLSLTTRIDSLRGWQYAGVHDIELLASLYAEASYSPRQPGESEREAAIRAWQHLRPRLWLRRVLGKY